MRPPTPAIKATTSTSSNFVVFAVNRKLKIAAFLFVGVDKYPKEQTNKQKERSSDGIV